MKFVEVILALVVSSKKTMHHLGAQDALARVNDKHIHYLNKKTVMKYSFGFQFQFILDFNKLQAFQNGLSTFLHIFYSP